jgi:hypothetical protein
MIVIESPGKRLNQRFNRRPAHFAKRLSGLVAYVNGWIGQRGDEPMNFCLRRGLFLHVILLLHHYTLIGSFHPFDKARSEVSV